MRQHITPDYREINSNFDPAPMPGEVFKPVPGYEGLYEVSDYGRVISHKGKKPRVLRGTVTAQGYIRVALHRDGKKKKFLRVHRLVALTHLGPAPAGKPSVLHANDIPADNRLLNLRYGDDSENMRDSVVNGTHADANKTHCPQGHPYLAANTRVTKIGGRYCISCKCAREAARRARKTGRPFDFNEYADQRYVELTTAPDADLTPVISASLTQAADDPAAA